MIMFEMESISNLEVVKFTNLPTRFFYTGNLAFISEFSEADAAEIEIAHITAFAATAKATRSGPRGELGLLFRPGYY
jgi:hypothetical protein